MSARKAAARCRFSWRCGLRRAARLVMLAATLHAVVAVGAESIKPASAEERGLLSRLVTLALRDGHDAVLSSHLSELLDLTREQQTVAVRQLGLQRTDGLWLLDVCTEDHDRLVLMSVSQDNQVTAYRMDALGQLGKAVSYKVGGETQMLSVSQARAGFLGQRDFWIQQARERLPH